MFGVGIWCRPIGRATWFGVGLCWCLVLCWYVVLVFGVGRSDERFGVCCWYLVLEDW
jgi:hypothetical protein